MLKEIWEREREREKDRDRKNPWEHVTENSDRINGDRKLHKKWQMTITEEIAEELKEYMTAKMTEEKMTEEMIEK